MKKCMICYRKFSLNATGPWCHTCVIQILMLLGTNQKVVARLVETTERIRQQLREAKAAGKTTEDTDVPGPYWGLDL